MQIARYVLTLLFLLSVSMPSIAKPLEVESQGDMPVNPLVRNVFTADPAARVFNNRMYVYTSHDEDDAKYYDMLDWHLYSTDDMVNWEDHGAVVSLKDYPWAEKWAWAPDCVERNGKYYFYAPIGRDSIGVAVADKPEGPFKDAIGKPLLCKKDTPNVGREPIDPSVLIDDDGQAYMYFGCRDARVVLLEEDMCTLKGEVLNVEFEGTEGIDKEGQLGFYGEAPWVFKKDGQYYMLYSNGWSKASTLIYATSDNPLGPFEFQGEIMKPVDSNTSHGSIVEYRGQWYVFYHTMTLSGKQHRRSVCFDKLEFDNSGKIKMVKATLGDRKQ